MRLSVSKYAALALLLFVVLVLVACQAAPTATPTKAPPTVTVPSLAAPTATAATAAATATRPPAAPAAASPTAVQPTAAPKATSKGKIVVATWLETGTADPSRSGETERVPFRSVLEALVDHDPKTMKPVGRLVEKWEQKDPLNWRLSIRKGVKFHDGTPWDAEAAKFNLDRNTTPESTTTSHFLTFKEAKVVDQYTLDVILKEADPIMPQRVFRMGNASPTFIKANPEEVPLKPIGTGPYKFVEWNKGQYVSLTANPDWWGGVPNIKDVVIVTRSEVQVRAAMLKTGEADLALRLSADTSKGLPNVKSFAPSETVTMRFNTYLPALTDVRVRQALLYAVDKQTIADTIYKGFATLAKNQNYSAYVLGHNPDLKPWPFDKEKAKQLLKDAGYKGDAVTLYHRKGIVPGELELVEVVANAWKEAGLNAKLQVIDSVTYRTMLFPTKVEERPDIMIYSHGNEIGDASATLDTQMDCKGRQSLFCDESLQPKLKAAREEADLTKRAKLYQDVTAYLNDKATHMPIVHPHFIQGLSKRLQWEPRTDDMIDYSEMKLSE